MDKVVSFPVRKAQGEPEILLGIGQIEALQTVLEKGMLSNAAASWACGAVHAALELMKSNLELVKEENR